MSTEPKQVQACPIEDPVVYTEPLYFDSISAAFDPNPVVDVAGKRLASVTIASGEERQVQVLSVPELDPNTTPGDTANYSKYRGKCKPMCEALMAAQPDLGLRMVAGWYWAGMWGEQEHWWCVDPAGNIHDPSKLQFPYQNGDYREYAGVMPCEGCGEDVKEADMVKYGHHVYCSEGCLRSDIGV